MPMSDHFLIFYNKWDLSSLLEAKISCEDKNKLLYKRLAFSTHLIQRYQCEAFL